MFFTPNNWYQVILLPWLVGIHAWDAPVSQLLIHAWDALLRVNMPDVCSVLSVNTYFWDKMDQVSVKPTDKW